MKKRFLCGILGAVICITSACGMNKGNAEPSASEASVEVYEVDASAETTSKEETAVDDSAAAASSDEEQTGDTVDDPRYQAFLDGEAKAYFGKKWQGFRMREVEECFVRR